MTKVFREGSGLIGQWIERTSAVGITVKIGRELLIQLNRTAITQMKTLIENQSIKKLE